jgi:hypothetical protein
MPRPEAAVAGSVSMIAAYYELIFMSDTMTSLFGLPFQMMFRAKP